MIKNIDTWFAFARSLGLGIKQMEEVVLVTGLHLTRSWGNVAFFEGQVNGQASLGVEVVHGPEVSIKWKFSPGSIRGGVRSSCPGGKVRHFVRDPKTTLASFLCMFRAYRGTNACLFEGSALLVFSGYCRGASGAQQDLVI